MAQTIISSIENKRFYNATGAFLITVNIFIQTMFSAFFFQFYLSYHLYIVACAGAGATVIALVRKALTQNVFGENVAVPLHSILAIPLQIC